MLLGLSFYKKQSQLLMGERSDFKNLGFSLKKDESNSAGYCFIFRYWLNRTYEAFILCKRTIQKNDYLKPNRSRKGVWKEAATAHILTFPWLNKSEKPS